MRESERERESPGAGLPSSIFLYMSTQDAKEWCSPLLHLTSLQLPPPHPLQQLLLRRQGPKLATRRNTTNPLTQTDASSWSRLHAFEALLNSEPPSETSRESMDRKVRKNNSHNSRIPSLPPSLSPCPLYCSER